MNSTARHLSLEPVSQHVGRVVRVDGASLRVRADATYHEAKRAVSCLVEPLVDDIVLIALVPNGGAYVLAVLERDEGVKATLSADRDLEIRQPRGRLTVAAQSGIDMVTAGDVAVISVRCASIRSKATWLSSGSRS